MHKFISTENTRYLTTTNDESAIPIHFITTAEAVEFLAALPSSQARWAMDNHFNAEKDDLLKLSNTNGELCGILVGLGPDASVLGITTIARIVKKLPVASYYLADEFHDDSSSKLLCIGWALAQYEYDFYKKKMEEVINHFKAKIKD